jgi:hypothetical protein
MGSASPRLSATWMHVSSIAQTGGRLPLLLDMVAGDSVVPPHLWHGGTYPQLPISLCFSPSPSPPQLFEILGILVH